MVIIIIIKIGALRPYSGFHTCNQCMPLAKRITSSIPCVVLFSPFILKGGQRMKPFSPPSGASPKPHRTTKQKECTSCTFGDSGGVDSGDEVLHKSKLHNSLSIILVLIRLYSYPYCRTSKKSYVPAVLTWFFFDGLPALISQSDLPMPPETVSRWYQT